MALIVALWTGALTFMSAHGEVFSPENYEVPGYIQVKCEPGVRVYLNNALQGETTRELGGLVIQGVAPGEYVIDLKKEGYVSQQDTCRISPAKVYVYEAMPFKVFMEPATAIENKDDKGLGQLVIQSLPVECIIAIPALGIGKEKKTQDEWVKTSVPAGRYEAELKALGETLTYMVHIQPRRETRLLFNFIDRTIIDIGELSRRQEELEHLHLQQQRQEHMIARFSEEKEQWERSVDEADATRRKRAFQRRLLLLLEHAGNEYRYIQGRLLHTSTVGDRIYDVKYTMGDTYPVCNYELVEYYAGDWAIYFKIIKDATAEEAQGMFDNVMKEMDILDEPEWTMMALEYNQQKEPVAFKMANETEQLAIIVRMGKNPKGEWDINFGVEQLTRDNGMMIPSYLGDISAGGK
ncbi:MAG: hypothetical protein EOM20_05200 [Spartobacteria bacterium]|nr:hypothetical protein [Spartobacteria bacterium]